MTIGFHLMFRADDDRVLAPSPAARRRLARAVYRVAEPFPLLAFGAADNHLHVVVLSERSRAAELARRLPCAARAALELNVPFAPVRYKELVDQGHCNNAFHYALGQRDHHELQADPYLEATSLPELLGLRALSLAAIPRVREHVPRVKRRDLLAHLHVGSLEPVDDAGLRVLLEAGAGVLLLDAAAATCALSALEGGSAEAVQARAALVHVLTPVAPTRVIAGVIGRDGSMVRRLRATAPPVAAIRALRLQVGLRLQRGAELALAATEAGAVWPALVGHGPGATVRGA